MRLGQAAGNRPWFIGPLVDEWLPSVAGLPEMLDGGTHVLEVGCGEGWASIAAAELPKREYDLLLALECVHDLPDPVAVLTSMRQRASTDAVVLVMDERTTGEFTGTGDAIEQLLYGWSVLICLPDSMSHEGSVATGTVMRPATLEQYATDAGFRSVEMLPIEHDLWRFYRLHA